MKKHIGPSKVVACHYSSLALYSPNALQVAVSNYFTLICLSLSEFVLTGLQYLPWLKFCWNRINIIRFSRVNDSHFQNKAQRLCQSLRSSRD